MTLPIQYRIPYLVTRFLTFINYFTTCITKKQKQRKRPKTVNHNEIQNCLRKKEKNSS